MNNKVLTNDEISQTVCAILLRGSLLDHHWIRAHHLVYVVKLDPNVLGISRTLDIFYPLNGPDIVLND